MSTPEPVDLRPEELLVLLTARLSTTALNEWLREVLDESSVTLAKLTAGAEVADRIAVCLRAVAKDLEER